MRCAIRSRECATRLIGEGILTSAEIDELEQRLEREAAEAAERALEAPLPAIEGITEHVYSEDLDPTSAALPRSSRRPKRAADDESRRRWTKRMRAAHHGRADQHLPA